MSSDNDQLPADSRTVRNKNWIWLFVVLLILSALAAGITLTYNLRQQLTPKQLGDAKSTWERFGPNDYDLVVKKDVAVAGSTTGIKDVLSIQVRNKRVTDVQFNEKPLERRLWSQYDMDGWFDWIERNLEMDRQPKAPRSFCIGYFDPEDGHLVKYVRSVSATGDRQEINIQLKKP